MMFATESQAGKALAAAASLTPGRCTPKLPSNFGVGSWQWSVMHTYSHRPALGTTSLMKGAGSSCREYVNAAVGGRGRAGTFGVTRSILFSR